MPKYLAEAEMNLTAGKACGFHDVHNLCKPKYSTEKPCWSRDSKSCYQISSSACQGFHPTRERMRVQGLMLLFIENPTSC